MGSFSLTLVLVAVFALAATAQEINRDELTRFVQSLQSVHSLQTYEQKYRDLENLLQDYPSLVQFLPARPSQFRQGAAVPSFTQPQPAPALNNDQVAAFVSRLRGTNPAPVAAPTFVQPQQTLDPNQVAAFLARQRGTNPAPVAAPVQPVQSVQPAQPQFVNQGFADQFDTSVPSGNTF